MKQIPLLCLYLLSLLIAIVACFALAPKGSSMAFSWPLGGANTHENTIQGNLMELNNTDYNSTTAFQHPDLGNVTENVTQRVVVEYGDYAVQHSLYAPASLPSILPPRIIIEYADASFQIGLQRPETLNQTMAPRIMIEYADYAIIFRLRYAYDISDDGKVDMRDVGIAARGYGSSSGSSNWNMIADINGDAKIDMKDIGAIARHYGERFT